MTGLAVLSKVGTEEVEGAGTDVSGVKAVEEGFAVLS
jgi:hypothetical protein